MSSKLLELGKLRQLVFLIMWVWLQRKFSSGTTKEIKAREQDKVNVQGGDASHLACWICRVGVGVGTGKQLCTGAEFQSSDQESLNVSFSISFFKKKCKQRSTRVCDDLCTAISVTVEEKRLGREWIQGLKGYISPLVKGGDRRAQYLWSLLLNRLQEWPSS